MDSMLRDLARTVNAHDDTGSNFRTSKQGGYGTLREFPVPSRSDTFAIPPDQGDFPKKFRILRDGIRRAHGVPLRENAGTLRISGHYTVDKQAAVAAEKHKIAFGHAVALNAFDEESIPRPHCRQHAPTPDPQSQLAR